MCERETETQRERQRDLEIEREGKKIDLRGLGVMEFLQVVMKCRKRL